MDSHHNGGETPHSDGIGERMRIAIISDIHGNYDAWSAFPEHYDELWVLGDLVNYGPQPCEVIEDIKKKASLACRGHRC